jgi:cytochrome c biogenesis protein CcdA
MKQIINYAITLVLWIVSIVLIVAGTFPYLFWLLAGLHFIELVVIGYKTGKQYGVSAVKSILMCMVFGYTWWLPLRKQIDNETFSDADFVRE